MNNQSEDDFQSKLYHVLRTPRRRRVISILYESELSVVLLRSLAQEIAAHEEQVQISHATGEPYRNVYNALSQTHLPTLSEASIVIYDSKRQTISRDSNFLQAILLLSIDTAAINVIRTND